jgi:hypothetical protein
LDPLNRRTTHGIGSLNMDEKFEQEFVGLKEKVRELQEYL